MAQEFEVLSEVAGTVWKLVAAPGQEVAEGDEILILESMKMETPVLAPAAGRVSEIAVAEKEGVREGQVVAKVSR